VDLPAPSLPRFSEPATGWRRAALIAGVVAAVELVALVVVALAFIAKPFAGAPEKSDQPAATAAPAAATEAASGEEAKPAAAATAEATQGGQPADARPAVAELPRARTQVLVLNGNGFAGAAGQMAAVVRALRYPVTGVGDAARRDFPRTIVMYRTGLRGEAERLARDLGLARERAVPLDGMRPADLQGAKLVVIVGNAS
jgi:hypothetical protein